MALGEGNHSRARELEEIFSVGPVADDKKIAENIKRIDPHGFRAVILMKMADYNEKIYPAIYTSLKELHDEYVSLSDEQRHPERVSDCYFGRMREIISTPYDSTPCDVIKFS